MSFKWIIFCSRSTELISACILARRPRTEGIENQPMSPKFNFCELDLLVLVNSSLTQHAHLLESLGHYKILV